MDSLHPLVLPFFIVLALGLIGGIAAFIRDQRRFLGFRHVTRDVLRLGKALDGEVFRDGTDLVVNGTWRGAPVDIRFSHLENTPGVDIRMGAPANFSLFVSPRNLKATEGAAALRTQDEMFNVRAQVRSNHPPEAGLFLSTKNVVSSLSKLYRSSQTYFRMTNGLLELTDLEPPTEKSIKAIPNQLDAMAMLAQQLKEMPGSAQVKIEPLKREPRYLFKTAVLVGVGVATVAVLVAAFGRNTDESTVVRQPFVPDGMTATDAGLISGSQKWRVALPQNLDPGAVSWLRGTGLEPQGRIPLDFSGNGREDDVAYVLVNTEGARRLIILSKGRSVYDRTYNDLSIAARVKKQLLPSVRWAGTGPDNPDGDGIFLLRAPNDPASGLIIFIKGDRIVTAAPKDYRTLRLE